MTKIREFHKLRFTKSILPVSFMAVTLLMAVALPNAPSSYADVPCLNIPEEFPGEENKTITMSDELLGTSIKGDVFVKGSTTTLTMNAGSCVGKNVFLEDGASLVMNVDAIVEGSVFVKAEGPGGSGSVTMNDNSHVRGDLLVEGKGAPIDVTINGMTSIVNIGGDILIKESTGMLNLQKFSVTGDVLVEGGATGVTINGMASTDSITGDILIKEAAGPIAITNISVDGDVSIEGTSVGSIKVNNNDIGGDIQLKKNTVEWIEIKDNDFLSGGDILVEENTATAGDPNGIEVTGNGGSNPTDIQMKNNKVTNDMGRNLVVENNDLNGNILMEKNTATGDLKVNNNMFSSGLLIAKENGDVETDNISVRGNGGILDILQLEKNTANDITVHNNNAVEFIEIKENTATTGDIDCGDAGPPDTTNSPPPVGSGNTAPVGNLIGQCSGLG